MRALMKQLQDRSTYSTIRKFIVLYNSRSPVRFLSWGVGE